MVRKSIFMLILMLTCMTQLFAVSSGSHSLEKFNNEVQEKDARLSISLARLHDEAIKKHTQSTKQELWRTKWYKRITVGAGVCAVAYGTYYLFLRNPSVPSPTQGATPSEQSSTTQGIKKKVTKEEILKKIEAGHIDKLQMKSIVEFIDRQKAATGFTGTLKSWGATTLNFVLRESAVALVFSAVMGAFGKYFKMIDSGIDAVTGKVFHAGNLQWYIATHTTIFSLLNDLEWHAHCIEHKCLPKKAMNDATPSTLMSTQVAELPLDEEQIAYHLKTFASTWALCVHNFESILGFMIMKANEIAHEIQKVDQSMISENNGNADTDNVKKRVLAQRYRAIIEHLHQLVDTFGVTAETVLNRAGRAGLKAEVNRLRTLFMEERVAFTVCENN